MNLSNWKSSELVLISSIKNFYENTDKDSIYDKIKIDQYTHTSFMSLLIRFKELSNINEIRNKVTFPLISNKDQPSIFFSKIDYYDKESKIKFFNDLMEIEKMFGEIGILETVLRKLKFDPFDYPRIGVQYPNKQHNLDIIYILDKYSFNTVIKTMKTDILIEYLDKEVHDEILEEICYVLLSGELSDEQLIIIIEKLDAHSSNSKLTWWKYEMISKFIKISPGNPLYTKLTKYSKVTTSLLHILRDIYGK